MSKIFISYYHLGDQKKKNDLSKVVSKLKNFFHLKDNSVVIGDIDPKLPDKKISRIIIEKHLNHSEVIVVIVGDHTGHRRWVDKEIGAAISKYGSLNSRKQNGLVVLLTDKFIKNNNTKDKKILNSDDLRSLITPENVGERIFKNCENGYAVISSYSEAKNSTNLIKLIEKSLLNSISIESDTDTPYMTTNAEICTPTPESSLESLAEKKEEDKIKKSRMIFHEMINDDKKFLINNSSKKFNSLENFLVEEALSSSTKDTTFTSSCDNHFLM